ncbi:MAG: hypothetical protein AAF466_13240 [Bacteroidota bacterium]
MRRFLKHSILFLFGVITLFVVFLYASSAYIASGDYFNVPKEVTMLFMGHSHSACAYEDNIIEGAYNISQNTEGYPYTYFKLKKLLEHNEQISRVFVEFTNNQITPFAKNRVSGSYLHVNMPRSFPVMAPSFVSAQFIQNKNPITIAKAIVKGSRSNAEFLTQPEQDYVTAQWRDHETPDRTFDPGDALRTTPGSSPPAQNTLPATNLDYLARIVALCENRGVQLFFVRSPMPAKTQLPNEPQFQEQLASKRFAHVPFLDFKNYPLPNDRFADKQHLNRRGQKQFSHFVNDWFSTGALASDNPGLLLQNKMETLR